MRLFAPIAILAVSVAAVPAGVAALSSASAEPGACIAANHAPVAADAAPAADADAGPTSAGGSATDTITVEVPEGRLYLEPDTVSVDLASSSSATTSAESVLVADLRDATPGWRLSVSVVAADPSGGAPDLVVTPTVTPIVGASCGVAASGSVVVAAGARADLAVGSASSGWGSYSISLAIAPATGDQAHPASVLLKYELSSL